MPFIATKSGARALSLCGERKSGERIASIRRRTSRGGTKLEELRNLVKFCRLVSAACCVLCCVSANAQTNVNPQQHTEQVETGSVPVPTTQFDNGARGLEASAPSRQYRIRLLPVSSFPQLPALIGQELSERRCMIPQTYEAHEPENVIHGSFERKGSSDWAVLCSVNRTTTLYVFFQSDPATPFALRRQPDTEWLGVEWSLDYGSAWGIATRPTSVAQPPGSVDHDGIEDSFVNKSTTVHYFENGQWKTIDGSQ